MKAARGALIFFIGLYAVGCQALLFRQFLVSFEGNGLGIGAFFGSWLVWIGVGAILVYRRGKIIEGLIGRFEFFTLLYLPAFVMQHLLIGHARQIMGIDPYHPLGEIPTTSFPKAPHQNQEKKRPLQPLHALA